MDKNGVYNLSILWTEDTKLEEYKMEDKMDKWRIKLTEDNKIDKIEEMDKMDKTKDDNMDKTEDKLDRADQIELKSSNWS